MRLIFIIFILYLIFTSFSHAADLYTFKDKEGATYYTNVQGEGRTKVALPVKKAISQPSFTPSLNIEIEAYEPIIANASHRFAVDPDLVRAIIRAESNFNHRAVSPKGAMGLMQLMPATAQKMAVSNPFDPEENIHGGAKYLSELLRLLKGNPHLALAAYNAGPGRVIGKNKIPLIEETWNYINRVMRYYKNDKIQNICTRIPVVNCLD